MSDFLCVSRLYICGWRTAAAVSAQESGMADEFECSVIISFARRCGSCPRVSLQCAHFFKATALRNDLI